MISQTACQGLHFHVVAYAANFDMSMFVYTGGIGHIYLWDLRYMSGGPVRDYKVFGVDNRHHQRITCLAVDPRQKTLLSGGTGGVVCWDLDTGASFKN